MVFRSLEFLPKATRTIRLVMESLENRALLAAGGLTQDPALTSSAQYGDANLDGDFNSMDLVQVFQAGKYETSQAADWSDGDWNFDRRFDSQDLIAAFQRGTYSSGGAAAQNDMSGSHGHRLVARAGEGEGIVNVSPEGSESGFSVEIQVAVWKTSPNTTFNVKRAFDFTPDGVCTSNNFIQFPLPNPSPLVQLTTSEGGAGATHIHFEVPQIADDTQFDVRFEVSNADASIVLRTECFTVAVK